LTAEDLEVEAAGEEVGNVSAEIIALYDHDFAIELSHTQRIDEADFAAMAGIEAGLYKVYHLSPKPTSLT
jgi:hypothetical protein